MTVFVVGPTTLPGPAAQRTAAHNHGLLRHRIARLIPEATTLLAVVWFLVMVARGWGGRDPGVVSIGAVLLAIAVVAVRPDRVLPPRAVLLAVAVSLAAITVAAVSPTGWAGAAAGSAYVISASLALVVAAVVVRRPAAMVLIAALVAAAGAIEISEAWLPWWGGADPIQPMTGTFYWHDPFAAFLVPTALVSLALWVRHTRTLAAFGAVGFVLASFGVLSSTSRAAVACLAAGVVLMGIVTFLGAGPVRRAARFGLAVALAAAAAFVLTGPPFFPYRATAAAAISQRTAGESLGQNGGYRLQFWHEALSVFQHHPVTGGGYHSLATASAGQVPDGWALSPAAHNGYLQALSDGGLLLAVPVLLAAALLGGLVLRSLWRSLRHGEPSVAGFAVPLALGAVLAHSAVDFDWTYVANLALTGVLAGLVLGHWLSARGYDSPPAPARRRTRVVGIGTATATATATATLAVAAWGSLGGDPHLNLPVNGRATGAVKAAPVEADSHETARTPRPSFVRASR